MTTTGVGSTAGPDDHEVTGDRPTTAEPVAPVEPVRQPTAGEAARTLLEHAERAVLSTLSLEPAGFPFGSVAPYGVLPGGRPVVCISRLAEHTRNLAADPRASVLVTDAHPLGEGMDNGRVTILGTFRPVDAPHVPAARAALLERHPDAAGYVDYGDFTFHALDVEAVRWVGGFGRMAWCSVEEYAAAEPDPTAPGAPGAVAHLNADHADSLLDAARAFTGHPDAQRARAYRLDRYGLDLEIETPRGTGWGRAPFDPPVAVAGGLRAAAVRLATAARARLAAPPRR